MFNPQLATFVCVADCGSFSQAAEKLYLSSTAVMKQLNALERHLELKLLERTRRGTCLLYTSKGGTRMGDTLDFPAFPGQPELDGMDRAQLLSCLERIQLMLEHLDELEPEDMDSDAYEVWGERHEALEDLADELQDRLDELE